MRRESNLQDFNGVAEAEGRGRGRRGANKIMSCERRRHQVSQADLGKRLRTVLERPRIATAYDVELVLKL